VQHGTAQHEALVGLEQRDHRGASVAGASCQRRPRRVHAGPGVDGLLPVVRQVVDEAADQRVRHQSAGGDAAVDDLRLGRLLHQAFDPLALAAAAGPLAVDVAVHEEFGRHDVQPFADVLADPGHRLAALRRRAVGDLGLVMMLDATQMVGQCLAARTPGRCLGLGRCLGQRGLQCGELRFEIRFVLQQRVLEHLALLGRHRLALGAELPALQPRQLERDLLDLRVTPGDVAVLALEQLLLVIEVSRLLLDVPQHLRGQRRDGLLRQTLQVLRLEVTHAEHASHLAKTGDPHAIGGCPVNARARVEAVITTMLTSV